MAGWGCQSRQGHFRTLDRAHWQPRPRPCCLKALASATLAAQIHRPRSKESSFYALGPAAVPRDSVSKQPQPIGVIWGPGPRRPAPLLGQTSGAVPQPPKCWPRVWPGTEPLVLALHLSAVCVDGGASPAVDLNGTCAGLGSVFLTHPAHLVSSAQPQSFTAEETGPRGQTSHRPQPATCPPSLQPVPQPGPRLDFTERLAELQAAFPLSRWVSAGVVITRLS